MKVECSICKHKENDCLVNTDGSCEDFEMEMLDRHYDGEDFEMDELGNN